MTTETKTQKGLTISFDDGDFTSGTVSVLLDLDLRTGTPVDETAWLDGNAGGSYPGSLTGFTAQNSDGKAAGSMRLVQIAFTLADAAEQVLVLTAGASKIIGVLGTSFAVADKTLSATFTNTGAAPAAKTGALLPAIVLHGEAAGAGTVTAVLLN
jgi:hypothetical protein|tara:strand:+ start:10038 stop:10502 length:465 start_codon:yes stop_codon:yes gene_type:complete